MARTRYGSDRGLTARMLGTLAGLGLLYVVLAAVLYALGVGAILVLGISGALLLAQWWFSDSLALSSMRAREVTPEQAPLLHGVVDRLVAMADMDKPRIAIADNDMPNAFATGRTPSKSVVVVTTGLLKRLDRDELEGVLAHELSHVAHKDVAVMTIASFSAILAGFLVRSAMWGSLTRDRRDQSTALVFLAVLVVSVLVYVVSFLLTAALSRYRELGADRGAALVTGQPSALARALQKVSGEAAQIPTSDLRQMEPVSSFAFVPALAPGRGVSLSRLLSTHPPLEKRLEQLARIAQQLGGR